MEARVRISVDSREELESLSSVASELGGKRVMFRINPDVSVKTHPKIARGPKTSKFGIPAEQVAGTYQAAMDMPNIEPVGLHCHIGSQILDISPFAEAVARMMDVAQEVLSAGGEVKRIDIGGGLGIQYAPDTPAPNPQTWPRESYRFSGIAVRRSASNPS